MYELKIVGRKYGRSDEIIFRQKDEFTNQEIKQIEYYAMHYWDCDYLQLEIIFPCRKAEKSILG